MRHLHHGDRNALFAARVDAFERQAGADRHALAQRRHADEGREACEARGDFLAFVSEARATDCRERVEQIRTPCDGVARDGGKLLRQYF